MGVTYIDGVRDYRSKIYIREIKKDTFQWVVESSIGHLVCVSKFFYGKNGKYNAIQSMNDFIKSCEKGFITKKEEEK